MSQNDNNAVLDSILAVLNEKLASEGAKYNSRELLKQLKGDMTHENLYSYLLSLQSNQIIAMEKVEEENYELTAEGKLYLEKGSPEYKFGLFVKDHPGNNPKAIADMFAAELKGLYGLADNEELPTPAAVLAKAVFGKAKQLGFIKPDKSGVQPGNLESDKTKDLLQDLSKLDKKQIQDFSKRSLVQKVVINSFDILKGPKFVPSMSQFKKPVVDLTEDMVKSGEWKNIEFAPLNFEALGQKVQCGHEHPLLKVRQEFRQIFFQMGFEEMDTSKWIESSFWNFDSLFQGQQHPCRDMHDTFFLKDPEYANPIADKDYFQRVKDMHVKGGNGSIGLRYDFSETVPLTNIMRTHTTAVSSRTLKMIADEFKRTGQIRPRKFFSIDRVYRNETLDATHLAEFHQVEGFVLDKNLTIADLMSYVKEFFSRIGLSDITFKPAYNPYTEPSMEIFARHPGLGKTIEIGNSGIFRPEMLTPMGIPPEWSVVAWGFSLERPTMIEYGINEIRSLEGPNVSLDLIENVPMCRLTF